MHYVFILDLHTLSESCFDIIFFLIGCPLQTDIGEQVSAKIEMSEAWAFSSQGLPWLMWASSVGTLYTGQKRTTDPVQLAYEVWQSAHF